MSAIGKYKPLPALSDLNPGLEPMDYGVLILRPEVEGRIGSIILVDTTKDDEKYLNTLGMIVAVSPMAFEHPDWPEDARKPQPGDHIVTSRHPPSVLWKGADGREYILTQDKEIKGVVKRASYATHGEELLADVNETVRRMGT